MSCERMRYLPPVFLPSSLPPSLPPYLAWCCCMRFRCSYPEAAVNAVYT